MSTAVHAQLAGNVAVDSDYRFRGVSLSNSKPTLRLSINYDSPNSWYSGASLARAESEQGESYAQTVVYGGYTAHMNQGKSVEVGATFSHFIGDSPDDYGEAYVALLAERWNVRIFYAPDYFGRDLRTVYAEVNAYTTLNFNMRIFGHLGALAASGVVNSIDSKTRIDTRIGAGFVTGDIDVQLAWTAATPRGPDHTIYGGGHRAAIVASASVSF
jgi:uncharacterized protein (TIGR02001 family)